MITIYLKRDYSKSNDDKFYFTDGENYVSKNFTVRQIMRELRELRTKLGIKVENEYGF